MEPLTNDQVQSELKQLDGWEFSDDTIRKDFSFTTFKQAMGFMVRVGFEAEALAHHPDWSNVYNSVSVRLSTHDAGNKVTSKDIELAKAIDKIYKTN
jgi:4a-hydroxytetrahydrobiopterin dehydratase